MDKIEYHIARLFSGEAAAEDVLAVSDWLNENAGHRLEFQLLENYWNAQVEAVPGPDSASFERVLDKVKAQAYRKRFMRRLYLFASSVAAVLLFVFAAFFIYNDSSHECCEYYTYLAGDSKSEITLDDGTRVILNKHSRLTCSSFYGTDKRAVRLDGEAFFKVMPDKERPFEVEMEESKIIVLGTTFDVRAFTGQDVITATLLEGSIRFESPRQQVVISPDQQLTYNKKGANITIEAVDANYETSWKDNLVQYKSVRLKELVKELEVAYHVRIVLPKDTKIAMQQVSGTFTERQKIEEVLDIITRSLHLQWHKQGRDYYIE